MKPCIPPLALAAVLTLAGCITTPEPTAGTPAPGAVADTGNETENRPGVGSHIRGKKNKTVSAEATQKMNADDFKQQQAATRRDATGDQILDARNEGR